MRHVVGFTLFLVFLAPAQLTFGAKHAAASDLQVVAHSVLPAQTQEPTQDFPRAQHPLKNSL
jgi:hypothetical protein